MKDTGPFWIQQRAMEEELKNERRHTIQIGTVTALIIIIGLTAIYFLWR
jgi:hypothetical protein